jgi:hypothetical protein
MKPPRTICPMCHRWELESITSRHVTTDLIRMTINLHCAACDWKRQADGALPLLPPSPEPMLPRLLDKVVDL